jgi:hypothetical protein
MRIAFELFTLALAGACLDGLALQQRKPLRPSPKSGAASPAQIHSPARPRLDLPRAAQNASPRSPQIVGRVVRYAPDGFTQHPGIPGSNLLRLGELVEQGEQIQTDLYGRAQIQLFNGPALNVGFLSTMRITAYDAHTQQIRLELPAGSVSVDPAGSTLPASSLEVWTATAVVDGVGSFVVYDPPRFTDVCAVGGAAAVRNVNPSVSGEVTINSGECTRVALNKAPTPPKRAPKLIQIESRFTSVAGLPNDDKIFTPRTP